VPVVVTDGRGTPTGWANVPFDNTSANDPRLRAFIASSMRTIRRRRTEHRYGPLRPLAAVRGLRIIPLLYGGILVLLLVSGIYLIRIRDQAERERVWAGMARESAHSWERR